MNFIPQFKPTTTISVNPPGGTGHPHHPHHPHPFPGTPIPDVKLDFLTLTHVGATALWVVFGLFTVGFALSILLAFRVEKKARLFHWLSATVLGIAMVSYFAMATGQGISRVITHYDGKAPEQHLLFRQVFYARYIDWLFTTPLLLVSLAFLAGLSPADGVLLILLDIGMIVTGLLAGLTPARWHDGEVARWSKFGVSCAFFVGIFWVLFQGGSKAASLRPRKTRGLFYLLSIMTAVLWTAYPIVFGLTEGANKISVDAEIIAYGVLDVAAKIGFTFFLLIVHSHGEGDNYVFPDWFVDNRAGSGADGRGSYGAIRGGDE